MSKHKPTAEQLAIITAVDTNVAVAAGAGSGKTQVLIGRFLYILERSLTKGEGADGKYSLNVDNIAAITFTKKAAAEMRARLRRELNAKLQAAAGKVNGAKEQSFWREQLERLPRTHISTIHSLCGYILRENPLEAGIDPQFRVAEEFESDILQQECLHEYVRSALRIRDEHITAIVEAYGLNGFMQQADMLLPKLHAIESAGDLLEPSLAALQSIQQDKDELCDILQHMVDNRELYKSPATYQVALETLGNNIFEVKAGIQAEPADFSLMENIFAKMQARGDFRDALQRIKALKTLIAVKQNEAISLPLVAHWQGILNNLYAYIQERKLEKDLLTFDDLENFTIALLQDNGEVRRKYHARFAHIMVDEFQDTNERQRQLVYLLCGNSRKRLEGNKLFVVGDPKQSIYRFRGADVSVFKRVQEEIAVLNGKCLSMNKNFRSQESVLKAVNTIFEPLMGTDTGQDVYFTPLEADVPRMASGAKATLCVATYAKEESKQSNMLEAELVAAKILQLLREGIPPSDITVLLRAMTRCDVLLPALQKYNIPFVLHSGRGFFEQQEVLDLHNLLKVLENKYRSLELAGVLRSAYFGLDDESITQLFLKDGYSCLWDALQEADASSFKERQRPLLLRARKLLAELRLDAMTNDLTELVELIWQKLSVPVVLSQQMQGEAQLANAEKLKDMILSFVREKQGTMFAWLEYVSKVLESGGDDTLAVVEAEAAVQIMTIHASKGLEFPVVILPFLETAEPSAKETVIFMPPNKLHPDEPWGLGIKAVQDGRQEDSYLLKLLREVDRQYAFEERKRLLYVAVTRAEQQVIFIAKAEQDKSVVTDDWQQKNWFVQLESILQEQEEIVREDSKDVLKNCAVPLQEEQAQSIDVQSELLEPLLTFEQWGNIDFSPTSLQSYMHCPRQYFYRYVVSLPGWAEEKSGSGNIDALMLGSVVHQALEYYSADRYDAAALDRCLEQAMNKYACSSVQLRDVARQMLEQYIQSELFPDLRRAQKELEFSFYVNKLRIRGVLDCLLKKADGSFTIIDYKSGRVPETGDAREAGYMYQLALYRLAVETLYGERVSQCELHYLRAPMAVELPESEYQSCLAEALALCEEICAKPKAESAFACKADSRCEYCEYAYLCKKS